MTGLPCDLLERAEAVLAACRAQKLMLATVESCTGGLIAACLTAMPGSSDVLERGLVTYSNLSKNELAGVPEELIAAHGAVSEPVARAMAEGVIGRAPVQVAVAVTGIAGPGGGSPAKPIGLVHLATASILGPTLHRRFIFDGDRAAVRHATVAAALDLVLDLLRP